MTVVGLGPAGPDLVTQGALAAIERIPTRFLRTSRHPSAVVVADATTFDHLYEEADRFADVYTAIADALVGAARAAGEVLYAVPGSPWVLERSVRHLLADDRVSVEVVPGLSFLDLAYARVGIDPIEAGVRLVDGHDFAAAAAGERGPMVVAHAHARWVLSDIKLAVDSTSGDGDDEVVVLQRLGLPDEAVFTVPWADLDRSFEPDHLTCVFVPRLAAPVGHELVRFHGIVRRLREECPWDRQQTHQSLTRYAIEEVYELVEAIGGAADDALEEELGDVLLQVFLHSAIAEQEGRFTVADVASRISAKMVRRHPHVFGGVEVSGPEQVVRNWEAIKAEEKGGAPASALDGVPGDLPALSYARELGAKAAKVGFDWDDARRDARQGGRGARRGSRRLRRPGPLAERGRGPVVRGGERRSAPGPRSRVRAAGRGGQVPPTVPGLRGAGCRARDRHPHGGAGRARRAVGRGEGRRALRPVLTPRPSRGGSIWVAE